MQCERAQEFFSDYLERSLDRPMSVAVETHLEGCPPCRQELESLREVILAMEVAPQVQPPPDGSWEVLCRLHQAQAEQYERERNRTPGFLQWLRGLSAANAAMCGGLATLVIAGTFWLSTGGYTWLSILGRTTPPRLAPANNNAPALLVAYGPLTTAGQQVTLQIQSPINLPDAHVEVVGGNLPINMTGNGSIRGNTPQELRATTIPVNSGPVAFRVTVQSPQALGRDYRYLVVVPVGELAERPVSLAFPPQSLETSLLQLARYLGKPVVVDASIEGNVQLRAEERSAFLCLQDFASQLGTEVTDDSGVYRLGPPRR